MRSTAASDRPTRPDVSATSPGAPSTHLVWLISADDRLDHAVTDTDTEVGLIAGQGTRSALCGHVVLICSLYTPPGPPCPACRARIAELSEPTRRWRRVLSRLRRPTAPAAVPGRRTGAAG